MNEAETRAELIDTQLTRVGWGVVEDSKVLRERNVCNITGEFDSLYEETQTLEAIYQQKTNNLEELKKSILEKVFKE